MLTPTTTTVVLRVAATHSRSALRPTITRATASLPTFKPSQPQPQPIAARPLCLLHTPNGRCKQVTPAKPGHPAQRQSVILRQTRLSSTLASEADAEPPVQQLDWNTFFQLRKTRRRIQVLFSLFGAAGCGTGGSFLLATGMAEPLVGLVPLDPFITMGIMAFSSATLGWLLGPILGSGVFNMWHRRIKPQMASKEREFFARIKKHRVDPSTSSVGNPVPDFYGEKISSVAGYRQWLKDQRAYNKKRTTFL